MHRGGCRQYPRALLRGLEGTSPAATAQARARTQTEPQRETQARPHGVPVAHPHTALRHWLQHRTVAAARGERVSGDRGDRGERREGGREIRHSEG